MIIHAPHIFDATVHLASQSAAQDMRWFLAALPAIASTEKSKAQRSHRSAKRKGRGRLKATGMPRPFDRDSLACWHPRLAANMEVHRSAQKRTEAHRSAQTKRLGARAPARILQIEYPHPTIEVYVKKTTKLQASRSGLGGNSGSPFVRCRRRSGHRRRCRQR